MTYKNRGNAKANLGQRDVAIKDYDEAIRLKPDFAEAYGNRGNSKAILGDIDGAREDYIRAKELFQNQHLLDMVNMINEILQSLGDPKDSETDS